jgi:hypothetical protein
VLFTYNYLWGVFMSLDHFYIDREVFCCVCYKSVGSFLRSYYYRCFFSYSIFIESYSCGVYADMIYCYSFPFSKGMSWYYYSLYAPGIVAISPVLACSVAEGYTGGVADKLFLAARCPRCLLDYICLLSAIFIKKECL